MGRFRSVCAFLGSALGTTLLTTASIHAYATTAQEPRAPTDEPAIKACEGLSGASNAVFGRIDKTIWHGAETAAPAYCEAYGVMEERTGAFGQHYAINYRLNLPAHWNRRFLFTGGGGLNGFVGPATGEQFTGSKGSALARGFAVVATDTGHDAARNNDPARLGTAAFAYDYMARLNWGDRAIEKVAVAAKQLIARYYGEAPQRSYFTGCSNGGREGVNFAVRYPDQFDGIIAAAPGIAPAATVAAWLEQAKTYGAVAQAAGYMRPDGLPDISRAFSASDLGLVKSAVLDRCDALDGLKDGMVQGFRQCTTARVRPALERLACTGAKTGQCLSRRQIDALVKSYEPMRDRNGKTVYVGWPWDVGIGGTEWPSAILGSHEKLPHFVDLGVQVMAGVILTPPEQVASDPTTLMRWANQFDLDSMTPRMHATTPEFPRSGWDIANAKDPNLDAFLRRGGKMILPHGTSDSIISVSDTLDWWEAVDRRYGGKARDFVRVFPLPGQNHCAGGSTTEEYDGLEALVNWVENGVAPDQIAARAGPQTPWPGRTRPLCPYPAIARYIGGDHEKAESFSCQTPKNH